MPISPIIIVRKFEKGDDLMGVNVIYKDEFLSITEENKDVFVETFSKGFPSDQLASILAQHPEIGITSLSTLRNSIMTAPAPSKKIGELKERIHVDIDPSGLTASVSFNLSSDELALDNRDNLKKEVAALIKNNNIQYGVTFDALDGELVQGKRYTIAVGTAAINGTDAIIKMYELLESKPEVRKDGKVDFYELKLINRVNPGDWLGERIEATAGIPGKTVCGEEIKPEKGKTAVLNYDKNSITEVSTPVKTVLYSRLCGAVNFTTGKISVSNHLEINGDVGVSTGNVKFDGFLTIKGTILDGFSVEATKDIEINGPYGLGNIKSLVSTGGSIFIKGGIAARERVEVRAAKHIFVKFADNSNIICGGTAHIGYYSLNSDIVARDVIFDSSNGQVIGGSIKSEIRVIVPFCGSDMERKTSIEVSGFNRQALVSRLDEVFHEIGMKKIEQQKLKVQGSEGSGNGTSSNPADKLFVLKDEIKMLEEERKNIASYLKTKGDGEISVTRHLYPNCTIILGGMQAEIPSESIIATFYLKDGEIKLV